MGAVDLDHVEAGAAARARRRCGTPRPDLVDLGGGQLARVPDSPRARARHSGPTVGQAGSGPPSASGRLPSQGRDRLARRPAWPSWIPGATPCSRYMAGDPRHALDLAVLPQAGAAMGDAAVAGDAPSPRRRRRRSRPGRSERDAADASPGSRPRPPSTGTSARPRSGCAARGRAGAGA